ncbi:MAG: hypothetical protein WKF77_27680 [Planctomycetaceae bacterium]
MTNDTKKTKSSKRKVKDPIGDTWEEGMVAESDTVRIQYDLYDLPTAQHKAGLAGLLLQIKSMLNRDRDLPVPTVVPDPEFPDTRLTIEFTAASVQSLFDDLYDATKDEGAVREKPFTKGKGADKTEVPPLRRQTFVKTDKKGNEKTIEGYVYLELAPSLSTLTHYLPAEGEWVKLWRDLIWQIIREGKKKAPYIKRAAKKKELQDVAANDDDSESSDASSDDDTETSRGDGSTWDDLLKFAKKGRTRRGSCPEQCCWGRWRKMRSL